MYIIIEKPFREGFFLFLHHKTHYMNLVNTLSIRGLICRGTHGCSEAERCVPQEFSIGVTIFANFETAMQTDNLTDTVDYQIIESIVCEIIGGPPKNLIEVLAGNIADAVLRKTTAFIVSVTLSKIRTQTKSVPEITITKFRSTI